MPQNPHFSTAHTPSRFLVHCTERSLRDFSARVLLAREITNIEMVLHKYTVSIKKRTISRTEKFHMLAEYAFPFNSFSARVRRIPGKSPQGIYIYWGYN